MPVTTLRPHPSTHRPPVAADPAPPAAARREDLADGLGWFSLALGVVEVVAPRAITTACGLRGLEPLVRLFGLRELAVGAGLLSAPRTARSAWLSARVAGDALDIATVMLFRGRHRSGSGAVTLALLAGVLAVDALAARRARQAEMDAEAAPEPTGRDTWRHP